MARVLAISVRVDADLKAKAEALAKADRPHPIVNTLRRMIARSRGLLRKRSQQRNSLRVVRRTRPTNHPLRVIPRQSAIYARVAVRAEVMLTHSRTHPSTTNPTPITQTPAGSGTGTGTCSVGHGTVSGAGTIHSTTGGVAQTIVSPAVTAWWA
jgi:hypothetical protein